MVTSFTRILTYFLTFLMGSMVLAVTWQIFTRFILNDPSIYSEEIAGFLLIWIGMLGSTFALHKKSHIGIDIFYRFRNNARVGVGIFHISNADSGYRNPGSETLVLKYQIPFGK